MTAGDAMTAIGPALALPALALPALALPAAPSLLRGC